jgi:hypothetical protein
MCRNTRTYLQMNTEITELCKIVEGNYLSRTGHEDPEGEGEA